MKEYEGKLLNNDCGIATVDKMIMNREEDVSRCRNFSSNFLIKQEAAVGRRMENILIFVEAKTLVKS